MSDGIPELLQQALAEMRRAGILERIIIGGKPGHRLTAAGHAEAARQEALKRQRRQAERERTEQAVALGYLQPIEPNAEGERRWLITEAGAPEYLSEEERAVTSGQWVLVEPGEPN